jgi:hypothetical protein
VRACFATIEAKDADGMRSLLSEGIAVEFARLGVVAVGQGGDIGRTEALSPWCEQLVRGRPRTRACVVLRCHPNSRRAADLVVHIGQELAI